TLPLASGRSKPSLTKAFSTRSNSRVTVASAPPRDSDNRQRRYSGRRQLEPFQTQLTPSALPRASRSSSTSHFGSSLRYSSRVVRRQTPCGFFWSCQKL